MTDAAAVPLFLAFNGVFQLNSRTHCKLGVYNKETMSDTSDSKGVSNNFIATFPFSRKNYSTRADAHGVLGPVMAVRPLFTVVIESLDLWHRDCHSLGGATRYQVVNSTDGVTWLPG